MPKKKIEDKEKNEDIIEIKDVEKRTKEEIEKEEKIAKWDPKKEIGREVKAGKIKEIDEIFRHGRRIIESEIFDVLLPNLEFDLIKIGQSKGKFGGGKRRAWRQTQKKTSEGNRPSFAAMVVVGDRKGHVGVGMEKAKETLPAREKAKRKAKLNIIKIKLGCGSFDCGCGTNHSIPFKVEGKCSSARIILIPAPKGTGLVVDDEVKKILKLAGIKDIYSKTFGQTRTKYNLITACINALKKINEFVEKE